MARFYFDDDIGGARGGGHHHTLLASTVYPVVFLGLMAAFMPHLTPLLMGRAPTAIYFDLGLLNIFFTN